MNGKEVDITLSFSAREIAALISALATAAMEDAGMANAHDWPVLERRLNEALAEWRRAAHARGAL
jgi:hypothetical protein